MSRRKGGVARPGHRLAILSWVDSASDCKKERRSSGLERAGKPLGDRVTGSTGSVFSFPMRLWLLFLALVVLFSLPFLLFGDLIEGSLSGQGALEWMRGLGAWGWAAGVLLLILDLFLPVPATAVLFGMGALWGPWLGAGLGFLGVFGSGVLGFFLARRLGRRRALWLLGREDLRRAQGLTLRHGGALVACSKWVPILPEVVSVSVGLAGMSPRRFLLASAIGSAPLALVFAGLGAWATDRPGWALFAAAILSGFTWWIALGWRSGASPQHWG